MVTAHDVALEAFRSRDARFDGQFIIAVSTTRIYCRPSCPAGPPKPSNIAFYQTAAAAQAAGFRACKRCRPDATPDSPDWNLRDDLVARSMRLIGDGLIDREGVTGLATALGYSSRHLTRVLTDQLGAGPLAIARAQRARTARTLVEATDLAFAEIAFAAGFGSIRQFNDTVSEVYALSPTELRARRRAPTSGPGVIQLRLPYRVPFEPTRLFGFLGTRCVAGVESYDGITYRRVLTLPHGEAHVALRPAEQHVACALELTDLRDLAAAVQRCRRLLDLDADPQAVDAVLSRDAVLASSVALWPGMRVPGHVDGNEVAVRAVLGQQVSVAGARTLAARLVAAHGRPSKLIDPLGELTHCFPDAATLADAGPVTSGMPRARAVALHGLVTSLAEGTVSIDVGQDRRELAGRLTQLRGIGPWTADYIIMRALGDPDIFLATDLGVRHALERLGVAGDPAAAAQRAEAWRPWRSYALMHLWGTL